MHFSAPFRGTFQFSLTVLVHYRFWVIFSLRSYFLLIFNAHYQGHLLWYLPDPIPFRLRGYHPLCQNFPGHFNYVLGSLCKSVYTTSLLSYHNRFSLGCYLFVRHYLGNLYWFLFHVVLRCFNSDGSTSATYVTEYVNIRFSFGHPGIISRVRLPRAYRSLPRPSSLLKPSNPSITVFTPAITATIYTRHMHDDHCRTSAVVGYILLTSFSWCNASMAMQRLCAFRNSF